MLAVKYLLAPIILLFAVALPWRDLVAGEAATSWQEEWNRTVKAAEQEGQLVLYSLSEIGEAISNAGFQKKFPRSKSRWSRRVAASMSHG